MLADWSDLGGIETFAARVRAGELDPVALTERALRRAGEVAALGAVVQLDPDGARRAAAEVARDRTGALAGVPVLVKEIIAVAGLPWTCGSRVYAGRVAEQDAEVVRRLRAAGAVIIGLSHSHEFAYGCTGTSNAAGPCRNPHDPARMTGGSSAGAAAGVAAGIVPLALGTDTAGSVRIPAALCGVVGAKPSRDTLPADGVFPLSNSLDHVGVLTSTVADARYAVEALGGGVDAAGSRPPRLAVLDVDAPSPEVAAAFGPAIGALGATGVELPEWDLIARTGVDLQGPEAAAVHADLDSELYQPDVRQRLRAAAEVPGWRYVLARARVAELTAAMDDLLRRVDAVLLPTVAITAPYLEDADPTRIREALLRYTRVANVTGHPAISLPIPSPGLPVGLQVLAADNQRAFAAAEWIATAAGTR